MMQPMLAEFEAAVLQARASPNASATPIVSSVTGTWLTDAEATHRGLLVEPVPVDRYALPRRSQTLNADVLLEVGVGETLTTLALQQGRKPAAIASMQRPGGKTIQDAVAAPVVRGRVPSIG